MTTDPRERLRRIDPAPVDAEPPSGAIEATAVIHAIERRTGMDTRDTSGKQETPPSVTQQIEPSPSPKETERLTKETGKRRRSGALVGAAAFAVVVIVAGGIAFIASQGDEEKGPTEVSTAPTVGQIAFASNRDGNSEVYVMDADGSNQTRLTDNPALDAYPSWSPVG